MTRGFFIASRILTSRPPAESTARPPASDGGRDRRLLARHLVEPFAQRDLERVERNVLVPAALGHRGDDVLRPAAGFGLGDDPAAQFLGDGLGGGGHGGIFTQPGGA
jgi:hypothetical protein